MQNSHNIPEPIVENPIDVAPQWPPNSGNNNPDVNAQYQRQCRLSAQMDLNQSFIQYRGQSNAAVNYDTRNGGADPSGGPMVNSGMPQRYPQPPQHGGGVRFNPLGSGHQQPPQQHLGASNGYPMGGQQYYQQQPRHNMYPQQPGPGGHQQQVQQQMYNGGPQHNMQVYNMQHQQQQYQPRAATSNHYNQQPSSSQQPQPNQQRYPMDNGMNQQQQQQQMGAHMTMQMNNNSRQPATMHHPQHGPHAHQTAQQQQQRAGPNVPSNSQMHQMHKMQQGRTPDGAPGPHQPLMNGGDPTQPPQNNPYNQAPRAQRQSLIRQAPYLKPEQVEKQLDLLFQDWSRKHFSLEKMDNIVKFASDQYEHAKLIVTQIIKKVDEKYKENRDEPFIDIIHEIITNVQGNYMQYFQEKLEYTFNLIWKKTKSSQDFIKLLKVFHIWEMFFDQKLLDKIYNQLDLQRKEKDFLRDEEWNKINMRKRNFKPKLDLIPAHLIDRGEFICGSDTREAVLREFKHYNYDMGVDENVFNQLRELAKRDNVPQQNPVGPQQPGLGQEQMVPPPTNQQNNAIQQATHGQSRGNAIGQQNQDGNDNQRPGQSDRPPAPPANVNTVQQSANFVQPNPPLSSNIPSQINPIPNSYPNSREGGFPAPQRHPALHGGQQQTGQNWQAMSNFNPHYYPQQWPHPYPDPNHHSGGYPQPRPAPLEDRYKQIQSQIKGTGFLSLLMDQYDKFQQVQKSVCEESIYKEYHPALYANLCKAYRSTVQSDEVYKASVGGVQFKRFGLALDQHNMPTQERHLMNVNILAQASGPQFNLQLLKEMNVIAITQLYHSIKFQCSNCGLRFQRNMDLKIHLDQHFAENNEIRKRKKIGPTMYPNYAVAVDAGAGFPPGGLNAQNVNSTIGVHAENRPLFQSFNGWIQQGKGAMGCMKTKSEIQSNIELKNIVPYSKTEDCCFMCKEKLKMERDQCISNGFNMELQGGGSGLLPSQIDENCYFIDAKRIRISVRNKDTGVLEKKEVTVHIDCFKQLEKIKGQKQKKKPQPGAGPAIQAQRLGKRPALPIDSQPVAKRLKQDVDSMKARCQSLIQGFTSSVQGGGASSGAHEQQIKQMQDKEIIDKEKSGQIEESRSEACV